MKLSRFPHVERVASKTWSHSFTDISHGPPLPVFLLVPGSRPGSPSSLRPTQHSLHHRRRSGESSYIYLFLVGFRIKKEKKIYIYSIAIISYISDLYVKNTENYPLNEIVECQQHAFLILF